MQKKRNLPPDISAPPCHSRLSPGGLSARFWCTGSPSSVVRPGGGRGALAALGDWQRVSPLQARGWPRGAERQSTVFSSGTSHFPLRILLSLEPHGTLATAQNPSSDAERGRAFTLTRGLGFAHQGPASTGTWGRCGHYP